MAMKTFFNSIYFSWFVLAVPSIGMLIAVINGTDIEKFIHPTGEFAARFMIIAMMLTPLLMLFPRSKLIRWLISRRRALGVAAFCYALVHTLFYLIDMGSLWLENSRPNGNPCNDWFIQLRSLLLFTGFTFTTI